MAVDEPLDVLAGNEVGKGVVASELDLAVILAQLGRDRLQP